MKYYRLDFDNDLVLERAVAEGTLPCPSGFDPGKKDGFGRLRIGDGVLLARLEGLIGRVSAIGIVNQCDPSNGVNSLRNWRNSLIASAGAL